MEATESGGGGNFDGSKVGRGNERSDESMSRQGCYQCGSVSHIRRDCPHKICWNCGRRGHEARMCRAPRIQGVRPNDMGGRIPAFVVDSIATPSEDHKALLQQMESGRREMMVKLEDMDRRTLRRAVPTLPLQEERAVARRPVSEGSGARRTCPRQTRVRKEHWDRKGC